METSQFAAVLAFAFVAAWIGFGFGEAVLCLLGAGLAYGAVLVARGEVDLGKMQDRLRPPAGAPSRSARARVR
jgi:hypothetical protein